MICFLNNYFVSLLVKDPSFRSYGFEEEEGPNGRMIQLDMKKRQSIYWILLGLIDDESKLQITCKLCQNILGPLADDDIKEVKSDKNACLFATVKDTFSILTSKNLKIGSKTKSDDEDLPAEILESKKIVLNKVLLSIKSSLSHSLIHSFTISLNHSLSHSLSHYLTIYLTISPLKKHTLTHT